jgi:nucleotide-binding universal stress UspA family protein
MTAALNGRLRVVHAVGLLEHGGMAGSVPSESEVVELARRSGIGRDDIEWCVVDGDPCSTLLREAERPEPAMLVVVGSRGAGAHAGTLLGSTSLELAEHATVPVAIVPTGQPAVDRRSGR